MSQESARPGDSPTALGTDPEQFLQLELESIKRGSNEEVARLSEALLRALEKRVGTADRFRKLHIHNANQLYEYEVADANAAFERALEEAKERIATETVSAHRQHMKLLQQQQGLVARADAEAPQNKSNGNSIIRTRRTADPTVVEASANGAIQDGRPLETRSRGGANKRTSTDRNSLNAVLGDTLPDDAVRADFVAIVRDMEQRAEKFNKRYHQIFSTLTQEDYTGIITAISPEDVIVKLGTGTRLRVFIQQIRDRRIVIRMDYDSFKEIEAINAAKRVKRR